MSTELRWPIRPSRRVSMGKSYPLGRTPTTPDLVGDLSRPVPPCCHYRGGGDRAAAPCPPSRRGTGGAEGGAAEVLAVFAGLFALAGVVLAGLALYVSRGRGASRAGVSLAVLLVAVAWWGLAYALEISADELPTKSRWGAPKYVGDRKDVV